MTEQEQFFRDARRWMNSIFRWLRLFFYSFVAGILIALAGNLFGWGDKLNGIF